MGSIVENISNSKLTIDSREVAEMMGKSHGELLRDIEGRKDGKGVGIIPVLEKGNFPLSQYFIESYYKSGTRKYKCYLITKMGCEILGNKQQGEKGILFTAKYVERFNQMEKKLKKPVNSYLIEDSIERAKAWIKEEEERRRLALIAREQESEIKVLKPKADYADLVLQNKSLMTITQIAKDYGMSGQGLNKLLNELGIQYRQSGQWLLYRKYDGNGYTNSSTYVINKGVPEMEKVIVNTKWTQKGRLFIYETLKEVGVLPVIEQIQDSLAN